MRIIVQILVIGLMGQSTFNYASANAMYEFPIYQYVVKEKLNSSLSLWMHKSITSKQVLESKMIVDTEQKLNQIFQIFQLRYHHMYLVSSLYLTCQKTGIKGCGQDYRGNIYYETTKTNLSKINDIPFSDSLHLYAVALKGFQILFKKFGYFDVFEDMFHICENGKLKIWCNAQIYKCSPENYLMDPNGREQDMIHRILHLIDQNVDKNQKFKLKTEIQRKVREGFLLESFQDINYIFRHICRQNKWYPPDKLQCLAAVSKEQIEKMLTNQMEDLTSVKTPSSSENRKNSHNNLKLELNTRPPSYQPIQKPALPPHKNVTFINRPPERVERVQYRSPSITRLNNVPTQRVIVSPVHRPPEKPKNINFQFKMPQKPLKKKVNFQARPSYFKPKEIQTKVNERQRPKFIESKRLNDISENESLRVEQPSERTTNNNYQYTDPKLIELLSSKGSQKYSKETEQESNQLLYSFKRQMEGERAYNHKMDTDIWEDLQRLKKKYA